MASLNKVILIGNLTRDPEIRYTPKGSAVCDLGLAVNRRYTTDSGEKQDEVTFLDIVLWGKTAELAGQYLQKGRSVCIEGRLQMDTWEDKTSGQKRSKVKIVAENLIFLDSKGGGQRGGGEHDEEGGGSSRGPARPAQRPASAGAAARPPARPQQAAADEFSDGPITEGMEEDDIPF
jgi:single-strand DNA-binding protein